MEELLKQIDKLPDARLYRLNEVGYQDTEIDTDDLKALRLRYKAMEAALREIADSGLFEVKYDHEVENDYNRLVQIAQFALKENDK